MICRCLTFIQIINGVPQCSIWGTLQIVIFVIDLPASLVLFFTDDVKRVLPA